MNFYVNLQLVLATAGTLFSLFLMILIVGYRRRRVFERVLFFLALALFFYHSGVLLLENATLFFAGELPLATRVLGYSLAAIGLAAVPGLMVHAHFAYQWTQGNGRRRWWHVAVITAAYLPGATISTLMLADSGTAFFAFPFVERTEFARPYLVWLVFAVGICAAFQVVFARRESRTAPRMLHNFLSVYFAGIGFLATSFAALNIVTVAGNIYWRNEYHVQLKLMGIVFAWVLPLVLVTYAIVRYKALQIGSQKNLVYSVSIAFLALLYLSVVRRVSGWAEPYFPSEAIAGLLLFLLLAFFEPLQRLASRLLRRGFQEQMDRLQKLSAELQREALRGESGRLIEFAEEHIRQEFGLELVRIHLNSAGTNAAHVNDERPSIDAKSRPAWAGQPVRLRLGKPGAEMGELEVVPVGSAISGEASAALDFLAEQLPAVIELCRVIEQKVALESELDERERMALVGQMAASISHNLKNPLGSMKTILQVQLENSSLPSDARRDLAMVLSELDRLSAKLNQLLQYARPAVRSSGAAPSRMDVGAVAEQVVSLLRHDAERRRVRLTLSDGASGASVSGPQEALADIVSNLIVNAIEAVANGGAVSVDIGRETNDILLTVTDDGPGIGEENRANVFQPFFTTKPSGTGLGLAIVERRAAELSGSVSCESPIANRRGARFIVRLPIANASATDATGE